MAYNQSQLHHDASVVSWFVDQSSSSHPRYGALQRRVRVMAASPSAGLPSAKPWCSPGCSRLWLWLTVLVLFDVAVNGCYFIFNNVNGFKMVNHTRMKETLNTSPFFAVPARCPQRVLLASRRCDKEFSWTGASGRIDHSLHRPSIVAFNCSCGAIQLQLGKPPLRITRSGFPYPTFPTSSGHSIRSSKLTRRPAVRCSVAATWHCNFSSQLSIVFAE